jgi:hypothetical protein
MKSSFGALLLASTLGLGASAVSAAPAGIDIRSAAPQAEIEQVQSERTCRRLRRACMFKDERGERGEGNCRRYRRVCAPYWR